MDRKAKLRKLNEFRRRMLHVSAAALSAILLAVATIGVLDMVDRNSMREARDLENNEPTLYGPISQHIDAITTSGTIQKLEVANPFAMLWTAVDKCKNFAKLIKGKLLEKPATIDAPWTIILYSDEVTPGNPLSTNNLRKFQAVYWSFLELGISALSREESWFCVTTEYSTTANSLSAGLSQALGAIMKLFFEDNGYNFETTGINLPFEDGPIRLFAKLGILIQDGGAHKSVWHARGDAASKLCLLCKNLFTESSHLCDADGANMLRCNVIKLAGLVQASNKDLRRTARYLESKVGTMSPVDFGTLQQALGMTYHAHSILLDRSLDRFLKPVDIYMHDWMHALFVDGVANLLVYLLFEAFIEQGDVDIYTVCEEYVKTWRWPGRLHGSHLHEIFARGDKHRKASHIKCQASDMWCLIGVLAVFVQKVLMKRRPDCSAACKAFLSFATLVDIIVATARITIAPSKLLEAVEHFLEDFATAFGYEWMTPKFHWLLHFSAFLCRFGVLLNCFCLERKHRVAKRYATELKNTSRRASKSLLMEVVCHQFGMMLEPDAFQFEVGLVRGEGRSEGFETTVNGSLRCARRGYIPHKF